MRKFLFIGLLVTALLPCPAQNKPEEMVAEADSLFQQKKYTESFDIYEQIIREKRLASPAMLLKMAYIKEGLGNTSDALYYLNLYYLNTADKSVLAKMEELADKEGLEGYEYSDFEFAKTIFYKYFNEIIGVLAALSILLFALMVYRKMKSQQQPMVIGITLTLMLILLFYTLNFGKNYNQALISSSNTYIMDGPSAGAEVLAIVEKGHRVSWSSGKDVWAQIEWKGQKGYVKENKLKKIQF